MFLLQNDRVPEETTTGITHHGAQVSLGGLYSWLYYMCIWDLSVPWVFDRPGRCKRRRVAALVAKIAPGDQIDCGIALVGF